MNIIDARLQRKLEILADAAKYDASCASSGAQGRNSRDGKGLGSTTGAGICHAYTPDGRCVSLLKILLTNHCVYDCAYCVNRVSANGARARFTVAGDRHADARLLSPQHDRGAVSFLRHHPQRRLHDGGDGARRPRTARDPRLSRLHPSQGDRRRRSAPDRGGGPLRRPAVDQHRTGRRREPQTPRAGEGRRRHPPRHGGRAAEARGGQARRAASAPGRRASRRRGRARRSSSAPTPPPTATSSRAAPTFIPATRCAASTIPPSARSRSPPPRCR